MNNISKNIAGDNYFTGKDDRLFSDFTESWKGRHFTLKTFKTTKTGSFEINLLKLEKWKYWKQQSSIFDGSLL